MDTKIFYSQCPVCGSENIFRHFTVKDHMASNENFEIFHCADCSLRFTQDVPDKKSIGRYYRSENYISHSNQSRGIITRLYHLVRKRTLAGKRRLVEKSTNKKSGALLEVGSGTGFFAATMQKAGWQVTGLEPDAGARVAAETLNGIKLFSSDHLFELNEEKFDAITLWHVLEHVHDLHEYTEQFRKLLKPDGKLIIAVPNYTCYDEKVYRENWAAYDVPRHLYHFTPQSMKMLMEKHGLKITGIRPMWYDSFYVSILSSQYKNGKTNWPGALWIGFRSNLDAFINKEKCSSLIYRISK